MTPINATWLAPVALITWPLAALWLYSTQPIGRATIWTILGGYLLLPVGMQFKIEMIPAFDKDSISSFAALLGCIIVLRRPIRFGNGPGLAEIFILIFLISPFITSQLNSDQIINGGVVEPGIGAYEGGSTIIARFVSLIPFFLGRQFLRNEASNIEVLRVLAIAGLIYSLPMLFEIRMSPQLHTWIYGYFGGGAFSQTIRGGGFRPTVFLGSGLALAFFTMTTAVAAAALWRNRIRIARLPPAGVTAYLGVMLALCKTLGAGFYGALLIPLVRWATPQTQLRVATVLVVIAVSYPLLRTLDLVPTTYLVDSAKLVSAERAGSLETRFSDESALLDRATQRFWFGWGRFGRSLIYDNYGNLINPPDGAWIVVMGTFGFFGFLGQFGLLALTVFRAALALKFVDSVQQSTFFAALALIVAINVFNLLPNSAMGPWNWLFAGALLGRAETLRVSAGQRADLQRPSLRIDSSVS